MLGWFLLSSLASGSGSLKSGSKKRKLMLAALSASVEEIFVARSDNAAALETVCGRPFYRSTNPLGYQ